MKNLSIVSMILLFAVGACAQKPNVMQDLELKNFKLLPSEVPTGVILRPIDKEAREMGISTNPANTTSLYFLEALYDRVDPKSISNLRLVMYVRPKDRDTEFGVNVIEYRSTALLNSEAKKMRSGRGSRFFKKGNYILIVWTDSSVFDGQVNALAAKLQKRLNLQEFKPKAEQVDTTTVSGD